MDTEQTSKKSADVDAEPILSRIPATREALSRILDLMPEGAAARVRLQQTSLHLLKMLDEYELSGGAGIAASLEWSDRYFSVCNELLSCSDGVVLLEYHYKLKDLYLAERSAVEEFRRKLHDISLAENPDAFPPAHCERFHNCHAVGDCTSLTCQSNSFKY
ncbi:hypothetical protein ACFOY8_14390 [Thalassospira xianhensis]|uniref:Uncharacterized protein n=1 Tax=Thalassospira xianhensis MCCC 1A02616 TaxID=1177929 RepID=A0A367UHG9_9PROT|nr:hypothetical protein [Thalassospira xianhensis]RCK07658.1 hypothetical protein TH5_00865 [Thalassospira xianhensis MCCC 1A02616]